MYPVYKSLDGRFIGIIENLLQKVKTEQFIHIFAEKMTIFDFTKLSILGRRSVLVIF